MKKNILLIAFALVPSLLMAQAYTPQTTVSTNRVADEDYYDEYDYDRDSEFYNENTATPSSTSVYGPQSVQRGGSSLFDTNSFVFDDTDEVYDSTSDDYYTPSSDNQDTNTDEDTITLTPSYTREVVEVNSSRPQFIHTDPRSTADALSEEDLAALAQDSAAAAQAAADSIKLSKNGDGHYIQFGFGGGWSGFYTHISEGLGISKMSAPSFTGSFSYFFYPVSWVGLGTGLQLSNYKGNLLMNPDAVKKYDKYVDAAGAYRYIEDSDGDRYKHRIGMNNFNEVVNLNMLEIPVAVQFKHKFGGVAGLYATLGAKIAIPVASTFKVQSGLIEHYGEYTQYGMTLRNVPGHFGTVDYTGRTGSYRNGQQLMTVNFLGYVEAGFIIRLSKRTDLMLGAYGDFAIHDISMAHRDAQRTPVGFNTAALNYPWMNEYKGLVGTDMLGEVRPYNFGVKAAINIHAAPRKKKKDKDDDDQNKVDTTYSSKTDTIRDSLVIIHDTVIIHRITDIYEYDTIGYDSTKARIMRSYMDPNSDNPYLNGSKTRSTSQNSYNPADGDDYVYNEAALNKGRKYSEDLHNRNEALSGDEQEMIDYLSALSIRFQLDKAFPPFVAPKQGLNVVAKTLQQNPDMVIAVNGHACRLGTEKYNRRLALRRARNIAKMLKMRGVDESQMLVASYGSHVPSAYGAHSLSKDRRVEIVMLGTMTYEQREAYLNKFAEQIQIQDMVREGQRDNAYDLYETFSGDMKIKKGTSLARLAANYYGDPDYWVYLYEANSDIISNPRIVEPGTELMVPQIESIVKDRSTAEVKREALQLREYYLKQIGYSGSEL